jgi:hypothetical protein
MGPGFVFLGWWFIYLTLGIVFCGGCLLLALVPRLRPMSLRAAGAMLATFPGVFLYQLLFSLLFLGIAATAAAIAPGFYESWDTFMAFVLGHALSTMAGFVSGWRVGWYALRERSLSAGWRQDYLVRAFARLRTRRGLVLGISVLLIGSWSLLRLTTADPRTVFVREFGPEYADSVYAVESRYSQGTDFEDVFIRFKEKETGIHQKLDSIIQKRNRVTSSCGDFYASLEKPGWWKPAAESWVVYSRLDESPGTGCAGLIVSKDGYIYYYRAEVD